MSARTHRRRSTTFRLALGYAALFIVSVLLLFAALYAGTTRFADQQLREAITTDIAGLEEQYRRGGAALLQRVLDRRVRERPGSPALYLLVNRRGRLLAGNLSGWPEAEVATDGWLSFELGVPIAEGEGAASPLASYNAIARPFALPGGLRLLVGRDTASQQNLRQRLRNGLAFGLLLTSLLAALGGWYFSRRIARRLEHMNQACEKVMAGDGLHQRIDRDGSNDEFDALAANMNAMLGRVEQAMGDVRRVSDNIAHDLRTPLARLRSHIEPLSAADSESTRHAADSALAEADSLLNTFSALLRIARIENGEQKAGFTEVDLTELLTDVAELYQPVFDERGQLFNAELQQLPKLSGDRDLLFQAVTNLCDNAYKYGAPDQPVTLSLTKVDDCLEIAVTDLGPGIPEEETARVVQRFQRLEQSRSSAGVGLGLSLVNAVAKLHDGGLTLKPAIMGSKAKGLRACLKLPITQRQNDLPLSS